MKLKLQYHHICLWAICMTVFTWLFLCSSVASAAEASFLHDIPVVQLTVDESDLWDSRTGLFAEGGNVDHSTLPYLDALYR